MELQREGDGFRVIDAAKNTVRIGTDGWDSDADAPAVTDAISVGGSGSEVDPDISVSGTTDGLEFPQTAVNVVRLDTDERFRVSTHQDRVLFEPGSYVLRVDSEPRVYVRFDGSGEINRHARGQIILSLSDPTPLTIRFNSDIGRPGDQITVGSSVEDVARALPLLAAATDCTTPDRTWPAARKDPAGIRLGEAFDRPDGLEPLDTGVELVVPPELRYLVTSASLVSYLGADVRLEQDCTPTLRLDGEPHRLGSLPEFQYEVASTLRRTFYLDCLAREAGPHAERVSLSHYLPELGLDADWLYEASMADRVRAYLNAPFDSVTEEFPEWNLSMYVEPSLENVECLPYFLEGLPFFFLPESEELDKAEWISLSMDDSYQHGDQTAGPREPTDETFTRLQREISNVDLVKPVLGPSRYHGWLGDDVPIDVFKTFPEAYENRQKYLDDSPISVVAVLNNADMREEHDAAVERYEQQADALNIDIEVRENITSADLARVFESRNDLVHFIGHSDEDGLECADGFLSISSVSESNTQTFFLNACGSYHEGVGLVRKGSVAGGVTFEAVTDSQAAKVGTTFARLMVSGYSMERALDKARQQVMTPKDYAVVGDGTHVLTQSDAIIPPGHRLSEDDDECVLEVTQMTPREKGGEGQERFEGFDLDFHLNAQRRTYRFAKEDLSAATEVIENPVLFDGQLYWSDELRELL